MRYCAVISATFFSACPSRLMWIIIIILFVVLDASPYARETRFGLFWDHGHSKAEKRKSWAFVAIAQKIPRRGLAGSESRLMKEAGLTVEALHIRSRETLWLRPLVCAGRGKSVDCTRRAAARLQSH